MKGNSNNSNSSDKNVRIVTIVREVRTVTVQSGINFGSLSDVRERLSRIQDLTYKTFGNMQDIDSEETDRPLHSSVLPCLWLRSDCSGGSDGFPTLSKTN
jgi:hypothetical protein